MFVENSIGYRVNAIRCRGIIVVRYWKDGRIKRSGRRTRGNCVSYFFQDTCLYMMKIRIMRFVNFCRMEIYCECINNFVE